MKERVTISVEAAALETARAEVKSGEAPNLSAAIENALIARKRNAALREALDLWEAEHGPITEEEEEWGRAEVERALRELSSSTPEH